MNAYPMRSGNRVLLVARLCLAAVFIYSGATKLVGWGDATGEFEALGIPLTPLAVAATVAVQLFGGLVLATGWQVRVAALALASFTIFATLIGHPFWRVEGTELQHQLTITLEHLERDVPIEVSVITRWPARMPDV
jgi:uncharacterized membrane protein YphA (DoxX/SURF4 family)